MRTLIVHCHPNPDSYNNALFRTALAALKPRHEVRAIDLYAEGFEPTLTREERIAYLDNPNLIRARVQAHTEALLWAEHLVFVYPTWFYGPPSMLKGWLERVWLPGVAFLPAERKGQLAQSGMRHIRRLTVVTTGGAPRWFLLLVGDPGRKLFTRALRSLFAWHCRVTWLQLHNMNAVTAQDRERFISRVARKLQMV